jgi:hypothetical protein
LPVKATPDHEIRGMDVSMPGQLRFLLLHGECRRMALRTCCQGQEDGAKFR